MNRDENVLPPICHPLCGTMALTEAMCPAIIGVYVDGTLRGYGCSMMCQALPRRPSNPAPVAGGYGATPPLCGAEMRDADTPDGADAPTCNRPYLHTTGCGWARWGVEERERAVHGPADEALVRTRLRAELRDHLKDNR